MRLLKYLALAALSVTTLAAKKPAETTFNKYLAKQASSAPIELDEAAYIELTSTARDYAAAVVLTAREAKYACQLCREFDPEWSIISKSWQKGDKKGQHRLLFGTLDFDQGRNVFMKVIYLQTRQSTRR